MCDMKKFNVIIGVLALIVVLGVCVTSIGSTEIKDVITIKYGHNYPTTSPAHKAAEVFKSEVESKSNGSMKVEIYPAMQLGSNREQLEALQQGSIQVDLQPAAIAGNFAPELSILDLPFSFSSEEGMWKVLDGDFGNKLMSKLDAKGIHGLGFVWTGFKQITASQPITSLKDLKGLKIRVMNSPLLLEQYKAWGSNPIPIDFSELYNALQQKVVDGEENNFWTIATQKYYEVQTDLAVTNHAPLLAILMANKEWYSKLTPEQQKIIDEAGRKAVLTDREELKNVEQDAIKTIKDNKVIFHEINLEELAKFKAASEPAYQFMRKQVGDDLVDEYLSSIEQNK